MPFYLFENITQETCKRFFEWVESKDAFDDEMLICSAGGGCSFSYAIIDWIKSNYTFDVDAEIRKIQTHQVKWTGINRFHTTATGYAHSGALLILSSGTNGCRKAYKHSTFMLHQPILKIDGNVSKLTTDLISLENDYDTYCEILAENTGKTALEIKNLIDSAPNNTITLNAKQALEFGIIDEIIGG